MIIADDKAILREALADLIGSDPEFELVGIATDAPEAVRLAREVQPDVALLDVRMPGGGGPSAAREIRASCPGVRVVGLSAYEDRGSVRQMLQAGAQEYLVKGESTNDEILEAIRGPAPGGSPTP